ncbi:MAG: transaldolase family protein [Pseudomonadota bacterium]
MNLATLSRLNAVADLGQQVWLDQFSAELIHSGELASWIADDGVAGMNVTASMFYNALRSGSSYRAALPALRLAHADPQTRFEALVLPELQAACDLFAPLHAATRAGAGLVSVALAPRLAHDREATVAAARRLWAALDRPNAMIAIPATEAGIAALEQAIFDGINVNATLVAGPRQLAAVRAAHRRGLARRLQAKLSVQRIASVSSMSVGPLDVAANALLPEGAALRGRTAIAAARLAWRDAREDSQFAVFAAFGARPQTLLWGATAASGPDPLAYMEQLIGPDSIQCATAPTLLVFRERGAARLSLADDAGGAEALLAQLARKGIDLDTLADDLLAAGLARFDQAHSNLLAMLE